MHDMLSSLEQHAADHGTSDDTTYWVSARAHAAAAAAAATPAAGVCGEGLACVLQRARGPQHACGSRYGSLVCECARTLTRLRLPFALSLFLLALCAVR